MMQPMIKEWWDEFTQDATSFYLTLATVVLVVGFGTFKGYGWYTAHKEQSAQLAVAEALEEYNKAADGFLLGAENQEVIDQRLDDARIAFDGVLSRHSGSALMPYVHALDADIFWFSGSKDKALVSMEKAIDKVSVPAIKNSFRAKYALMLMEADRVQEGLDLLTTLANDPKNSSADYAAYNLGYYYWVKGDEQAARQAWQVLETFKSEDRPEGSSPWLYAAQKKLSLLS